MAEERLQKVLARAGYGSRRACEELIVQGRALVNGRRVELGTKADPATDRITVDGDPVKVEEVNRYIALYKPRNVLSDEQPMDNRRTVRDLVESVPGHLFSVGRLDFDSEGLILLTNDGALANRLTHPRYGHEKEYRVLVATRPDEKQLATWRRGVVMEDGYKTQPARVEVEANFGKGTWLRIILREGKKRQIREVGKLLALPVVRIIRVRIGDLLLGNLKAGEWRYLTPTEVESLRKGSPPVRSARPTIGGRPAAPGRSPRSAASRSPRERRPERKSEGAGKPAGERKWQPDRKPEGSASSTGERKWQPARKPGDTAKPLGERKWRTDRKPGEGTNPTGERKRRSDQRPADSSGKPTGERKERPQRRNPHPPSRRGTK